jgi:MoxR-like ATPase
MSDLKNAALSIRNRIRDASKGLVGRDQLAELIVLAAVAQEHLLVIGPPGTAKSAMVRRIAQVMGGQYFEYLLGRFTEPSEIFGAVDLKKLKDGTVETDVRGMLPEAEIAFLDEVFLGSTAILNTLLSILNERRFRRGHTQMACPLRVCVGASNALPEDEALAAFADRFLLHVFVQALPDHQLEAMLAGGWASDQQPVLEGNGLADLDTLSRVVGSVSLEKVRPTLVNAIRRLREAGIAMSDRRIVKSQRLIAAAAVLGGRLEADDSDLWSVLYALPTQEAQLSAREVLRELLAKSENANLLSAVEQATLQPLSRVSRFLEEGRRCSSLPDLDRRLQAESLLREIDANFSAETLPEALATLRSQLRDSLQAAA